MSKIELPLEGRSYGGLEFEGTVRRRPRDVLLQPRNRTKEGEGDLQ